MNATDDWYEVSRLGDRSYRIVEADDYGAFLLEGSERALLIDAGVGVGDLRGLVAGLTDLPVTLLLTHTHWDHIGAAAGFETVLVHPAERPADGQVAVDTISAEFVHRPATFLDRWLADGNSLPEGVEPAGYDIAPVGTDPLPATGRLDLGDRALRIEHLPGHSPGHVGVLDADAGVLYGGDLLHYDRGIYAMFADCDLEAYVDSLARVRELREAGAVDTLATSHNEPLSGGDLALLEDLLAGLREILAGERDPEPVETDWGPAHRYRIGDSPVLTDTSV
jgi:glyoxylase-like metal-dependent hydrolase (beta-lactamase superfamily II)